MKLTLVNCGDPNEPAVVKYQPMATAYLAAYTPPNWDIELVDENFEVFRPEHCKADLVAFSSIPRHIDRAYTHANMLKKRGIATVAGGMHVSAMPEEAVEHFDSIVEGEAEPIWAKLLADFERGSMDRHYVTGFESSLDELKLPDRRYIHPGYKLASASTSRGCQNSCSFCYMGSYANKAFRLIPTETIVEDFARIPQKIVVLTDANFLGFTSEHIESRIELCETLIRCKISKYWGAQMTADIVKYPELPSLLYRAGCRLAFVGFETIGANSLGAINKSQNADLNYVKVVRSLQDAGIPVAASFILGVDTHDGAMADELKTWLDKAQPIFLNLGVLTPMPNTAFYKRAKREGRLLADGVALWKHLDKSTNTIKYAHLDNQSMEAAFEEVIGHFFRPRMIVQTFFDHVVRRKQVMMPALYIGAALRKRQSRCRSVAFAEPNSSKNDATFRFLSWNINQWPLFSASSRCQRDLDRVRDLIEPFDLVCLQECWSEQSQELRWSFPFHYFEHERAKNGLGSGLLILSKHPIRSWAFRRFPKISFPDSMAAKGVMAVTIDVPGFGELDLVGTHLQAWGDNQARSDQIRLVSEMISEYGQSPFTIIAGDLNSTARSDVYRYLRSHHTLVDLFEGNHLSTGSEAPRKRWPFPLPERLNDREHPYTADKDRIDHVFLQTQNGAAAEIVDRGVLPDPSGSGGKCPSDHRGLFVSMKLRSS